MTPGFIHLRVHSEYSLANGVVRVKPLVNACVDAGMPAVAVTDQCNLFAMVKFYKAAMAAGVKPIVGVDLWVHNEADPHQPSRVVLLCQDREGYLNLTRLISRSYIEGQERGVATIHKEWLEGASAGLIALSGGKVGEVGQALLAGNRAAAEAALADWMTLFPGRFYIELQRTGRPQDEEYLHAAVALAGAERVPVVATNDVHFLQRDDFGAHEARVCIHDGRVLSDPRRPRHYSEWQYLRSAAEMAELFADLPEALENTVEIAQRCNLQLTLGQAVLPEFPVPEGMTTEEYFRQQAQEGLERRLAILFQAIKTAPSSTPPPGEGRAKGGMAAPSFDEWRKQYDERLAIELDVIIQMGFPGYFLIVADFIRWAKHNDVPVGPGRGSGAGSLVAYAMDITDLDPMRYDLLFERFLNPERVSMPDFDVDFCMEGRDRVIDYVVQRYGRERVSQIITYGSMAAKAVVRDVGRVLGHPYGFVDQIAKLIPFELGITLDKALEQEEQLRQRYENEEDVRDLIDLARKLEGMARNAGKHAGGVVIAPSELTDFTPLFCESGGSGTVTQFDKDDVEAVGLVKFDFLGLRTLTIIDWAVKIINRQRREAGEDLLDITRIPLNDAATFALLKRCTTTAVFQLESQGMKDLIKRLQPDSFEDIVALVALFRPGPLQSGMVDDFINRKHGRIKVEYPHPELETILKPTYGVILYQEQVMQIAQVLAGYTLGGADLLRRAMGKKKPEEMAKQREIFVEGAKARGVAEKTATYIFDLMEKFAGYGFNKSHSAAYALVSYQTAWLKAHHPAAFMAAVMSADMHNTDKVVTFIDETHHMGLEILPPDVNRSTTRFAVQDEKTICYGLGAIKGVGTAATDSLVAEREQGGHYQDLFDFCRRVDLRKMNRRALESLVRCGALDHLGPNRATLMASLASALQLAEQHGRDEAAGQDDLFGNLALSVPLEHAPVSARFVEAPEWSDRERLEGEKETLGLYLTGHPIEQYQEELANFVKLRIADIKPEREQKVIVAGLVVAIRARNSRRGDRIAFVTLDDRSGRIELAVFSEAYNKYRNLIVKDKLLVVEGTVSVDEYSGGFKMSAEQIFDIDQAREQYARRLEIGIDGSRLGSGFPGSLAQVLEPFREGRCQVCLEYQGNTALAKLLLGPEWRVRPSEVLLHRLKELAGADKVRVVY
jgi:DNA polymerase-3 subunit alpha